MGVARAEMRAVDSVVSMAVPSAALTVCPLAVQWAALKAFHLVEHWAVRLESQRAVRREAWKAAK